MAERWTADGGRCAVGPDCALSFESVAPVSAIFWRLVLCSQCSLGICGLGWFDQLPHQPGGLWGG